MFLKRINNITAPENQWLSGAVFFYFDLSQYRVRADFGDLVAQL